MIGAAGLGSDARAATMKQQLVVCHATHSCSPCTCAVATSGPSATSPDSMCHQVTRWDQPLPWEQADYAAKQAQAQQRALLTLLGGLNRVVASTVRQGSAIAGDLAAAGAVSAAQLQQFVAEASELGAAAASLMAKAVASFAPAPQYEGPQPEQFYLQHQQQQQQREPAMHPLAFHKLALAATHPQLWAQMSVEVPLHHAAHQAQQQMQQGLDAVAFLSGVTPATTAVITHKFTPQLLTWHPASPPACRFTSGLSRAQGSHVMQLQQPQQPIRPAVMMRPLTCLSQPQPQPQSSACCPPCKCWSAVQMPLLLLQLLLLTASAAPCAARAASAALRRACGFQLPLMSCWAWMLLV
jgi:hypothetical protein